jgi:hypothetical protein
MTTCDYTTIYVELLDEGTKVWRPVKAERAAEGVYRIVSEDPDPELEHWQFPSGALVRCEWRKLSRANCLVAVSLAEHAA